MNITVCHLITGLTISGDNNSTENTSENYTGSVSSGNLLTYTWSATNGAIVTSGQGSIAATIQFATGLTSIVTLDVTDCDGNHYTTTKTVTLGVVCILIASCSFS